MSADTQIIAQVLGGDTEAFRQLVVRHQTRLIGLLMRIVGDPVVAEEVAHEAFVKAYTRLSGFRGDAAFGTWLTQIAINQARDHQRRQSRTRNLGMVSMESLNQDSTRPWEPVDSRQASNPAANLEGRLKWQTFEEALASLPADFREAITLRYLEDMSYDEISRLTGDTVGTLKVRNHRARKLLRDTMD